MENIKIFGIFVFLLALIIINSIHSMNIEPNSIYKHRRKFEDPRQKSEISKTSKPEITKILKPEKPISKESLAMLIPVPFMLITSLVYLFIPELRNTHGKSLVCYLIGMSIANGTLAFINLNEDPKLCRIGGFVTYFFFMNSFAWLNVISLDLWWNFKSLKGNKDINGTRLFIYYWMYAWGLSGILLAITVFAQLSNLVSKEWRPHIGDGACFLQVNKGWSAMVYFFGPLLIIISINTVLFTLIAIKIHFIRKEISNVNESKKTMSNKDKFVIYFRLFIVMGVTWTTEIIGYISGKKEYYIFYAIDLCNILHGFTIFLLFVLKKQVLHLIKRRFRKRAPHK